MGENGLAWRRDNGSWQQFSAIEQRDGDHLACLVAVADGVYAAQRTAGQFTGGGLGRVWRLNGATAAQVIKGLSQPLDASVRTGSGYLYGFDRQLHHHRSTSSADAGPSARQPGVDELDHPGYRSRRAASGECGHE